MTDQPGDEYEALFRPDEPVPPVQNFEVEDEVAVVEPRSVGPIETGRVFRSQGVQGNEEALLALSSARTSKLRTLERVDVRPESEHVSEVGIAMHSPVPERAGHVSPPVIPREERSTQHTQYTQRGAVFGSLGALYVYGITIGVTLVFGLLDVLIFGGEPGALAGFGLLVAAVFGSLAVRSQDDSQAIFAPAIAFFVMAITVGQINVTDTSLINRFVTVFFVLGNNWYWVIGSTIIALGVVAFRRRSSR